MVFPSLLCHEIILTLVWVVDDLNCNQENVPLKSDQTERVRFYLHVIRFCESSALPENALYLPTLLVISRFSFNLVDLRYTGSFLFGFRKETDLSIVKACSLAQSSLSLSKI